MEPAAIIQKARDAAGLERFDSESFREGLEIAAAAVTRNPLRTLQGEAFLEHMYVQNLVTRLKVADYARRRPEIVEAPIERPIFIMGMPRTGTTLASYLLGADPGLRSLLRWEVATPVPPATPQTLHSDPRMLAMRAADDAREAAGHSFAAIHYEASDGPTEDTFVMAHDFKSLFVESLSADRDYSDWFLRTDLSSAYTYHRLFLQVLQSGAPGTWSLKLPSHALGLRALMGMYPDARIVWTHRDPYRAASSLMSMISKAERLTLRESDLEHIRRTYPKQLSEHVRRPMQVQDEHDHDPFYHLHYSELTRDPLGQMRKLYGWLGEALTPEAETAMRRWLDANPQGRFGKHAYGLEEFGFRKGDLTPFFEDYLKRFDIEAEG